MKRANAAALAALLLCGAAGADQFGAMNGLWKTTYQVEGGWDKAPEPRWRCAVEGEDPWLSYAQLRQPPGYSCRRTSFERTGSALKWRWECAGPEPFSSEGALTFDTPKHYSGEVTLSGSLLDYPLRTRLKVEGSRVAACTSPTD